MRTPYLIIIFLIILLVIGGGAYYFGIKLGAKKGYEEGVAATEAAYKELLEKARVPAVSPMKNLPTTNPFEEVKVNPFEEVYKNPFK